MRGIRGEEVAMTGGGFQGLQLAEDDVDAGVRVAGAEGWGQCGAGEFVCRKAWGKGGERWWRRGGEGEEEGQEEDERGGHCARGGGGWWVCKGDGGGAMWEMMPRV